MPLTANAYGCLLHALVDPSPVASAVVQLGVQRGDLPDPLRCGDFSAVIDLTSYTFAAELAAALHYTVDSQWGDEWGVECGSGCGEEWVSSDE